MCALHHLFLLLFALKAFDRIASYLEFAKSSSDVSILAGGNADKRQAMLFVCVCEFVLCLNQCGLLCRTNHSPHL